MVWRNVQVARPSDSTSGGQCAGRRVSSSFTVVDVDADAASAAAAAVEEAIARAAESLEPFPEPLFPRVVVVVVLPVVPMGGFQLRKDVQILQGLPSGPRTMPGGSGRALDEKGEDCAVEEVSVLLELVPIVTPRKPRTRNGKLDCTVLV